MNSVTFNAALSVHPTATDLKAFTNWLVAPLTSRDEKGPDGKQLQDGANAADVHCLEKPTADGSVVLSVKVSWDGAVTPVLQDQVVRGIKQTLDCSAKVTVDNEA